MAVHGHCSHVRPDVVVVHCHDIGVGDDGIFGGHSLLLLPLQVSVNSHQ